ncbi:MAG: glucose 1-dehydrogenase [Deinococcus sp.]|nr:glucose 1-dehydrogenase [Deinococcus sp.]
MGRLQGRVALVTGASRGIGRGCALCLAEEGADVVINYRTHEGEAARVADEVKKLGQRALVHQADVADRQQVAGLVQATIDHFSRLDIVVANAASSVRQPVIEASWEGVKRTIDVSLFGVFHTCQFAAQRLVAQGQGGKIIIMSSVHAELPFKGTAAYNMAKAAINILGATLANELTEHHINVNVVNPGWIDTPGEREFFTEAELQAGAQIIPWKRLGTVRDIGRAVVFLASDDADYMTGTVLRIDGGFTVGLSAHEA